MDDEDELREVLVRIEDGEILIKVPGRPNFEYPIGLDRCKNKHDVVSWINHLCDKSWVTGSIVRRFISVVYAHHGWKLY